MSNSFFPIASLDPANVALAYKSHAHASLGPGNNTSGNSLVHILQSGPNPRIKKAINKKTTLEVEIKERDTDGGLRGS